MSRLVMSVILLALVSSHAFAQRPGTNDAVRNFQDLCNTLGPFVPMREVRTEQFCSTSQLDRNQMKCALLDAMEAGLIKAYEQSGGGGSCKAPTQTPAADKSITGASLPFALSDQRPLPDSLPSSLFTSEGGSYYWLWKNLFNFNQWAGCAATSTAETVTPGTPKIGKDWLVPAGWTVHSTLWQPNGGGKYWPFATIVYKGSEVAIFVRGSQTEQDWKADFDYSTTKATLQPGNIAFPGLVHQGFASVATSLWPGVAAALTSLSASGKISNVYVAGHSLGAGVSTLLSYGVQAYLDNSGIKAKVDALLFAPPNAGDTTFTSQFGSKVNARRMPFVHDIVPQVPCAPSMVSCRRAPIPTGNTPWAYSAVPGTLLLYPSGMPQQSTAWSHFNKIFPCRIPKFFQATHVCAYNCYMSQFAQDGNTMCKLWDKDGPGTFCTGYPSDEGRPYPYLIG